MAPSRLCVWIVAGLLCSGAAQADDAARLAQSKTHFRLGRAAYDRGDWDTAVHEYMAAHEAYPAPELLFNIAQAFRLRGDKAKAIDYYGLYLEADPHGRASDEARVYKEALTAMLVPELMTPAPPRAAPEPAPPPPAPAPPPPAPAAPPPPGAAAAPPPAPAAASPAAPAAASPVAAAPLAVAPAVTRSAPPRPLTRRAWFWVAVVGGVVVVAAAVGIGVALGAPRDPSPTLGIVK